MSDLVAAIVPPVAVLLGVGIALRGQRLIQRDQRLWDRRATLYVELLRWSDRLISILEFEDEFSPEEARENFLTSYEVAERVRHDVDAFASDGVHDAFQEIHRRLSRSEFIVDVLGEHVEMTEVSSAVERLGTAIHRELDPSRKSVWHGLRSERLAPKRQSWRSRRRVRQLTVELQAALARRAQAVEGTGGARASSAGTSQAGDGQSPN